MGAMIGVVGMVGVVRVVGENVTGWIGMPDVMDGAAGEGGVAGIIIGIAVGCGAAGGTGCIIGIG
ncbi:MAG TPA: hypothetical protein VKI43_14415 [Vicinamibacterales bacterium]|nr:hypothetical protein [Vicinamibacterales bacterium]